jgi:hypothetical protein
MNYEKNKKFQTNPIFKMPKMFVNLVKAMTNSKKQQTMSCQKQSQNKPKL